MMAGVQKRKIQWANSLLLVMLYFYGIPTQAKYGGGTGEPNDPYLIYTAEQMNAIGAEPNDWDKHFKLMADIDLSAYTGTDFSIIGYYVDWDDNKPFTGVFDGNGKKISNFSYNTTERDYVGLFGYVRTFGKVAVIKNLGLIDPNIDAGTGNYVGSLIGWLRNGTITSCYVEGGIVSGNENIGGLVGAHGGTQGSVFPEPPPFTISNCYSTATVIGVDRLGGLVGSNYNGPIYNCYATGPVSGDENIGGLAGYNFGTITNCYSTGGVSGNNCLGGLVGTNPGSVTDSYSTGVVSGHEYVGGLVGKNWYWFNEKSSGYSGSVTNSYSIGPVSGIEYIGGLVGSGYPDEVISSFWDTETSGQTTSYGGNGMTTAQMQTTSTFIGWGECGSAGTWTIDGGNDYPRLWWENKPGKLLEGQLSDFLQGAGTEAEPYLIYTAEQMNEIGLYEDDWDKHFKLMEDIDLSGLDGREGRPAFRMIAPDIDSTKSGFQGSSFTGFFDGNGHTISHLTIEGLGFLGLFGRLGFGAEVRDLGLVGVNITASEDRVGGLVGLNNGFVTRSYSTGVVRGDSDVGGLVGINSYRSNVVRCYSIATVGGDSEVGGLAGSNSGFLIQCYSTGTSSGNKYVGGLVGTNTGFVTRCYSAGTVSGNELLGGLLGRGNSDRVSHSLWDIETTGQGTSAGGIGLTTAEMMDPVMLGLNGFGGDPDWVLSSAQDYPRLAWQGTPGQMIPEPPIDWLDGAGTLEDPFRIETAHQFLLVHKSSILWNRHFALNVDVDLDPNLLGRSIFERAVIPTFEGHFFGNGYKIVNLQIEGGDGLGLFGRLAKGSVVRDLGLENVSIHGTGFYIGGLVGLNSGNILNCYCRGTVSGHRRAGVLVGYNYRGGVTRCYSTGTVTGDGSVGGLVGWNDGNIATSYSTGTVSGNMRVGGLVGDNFGSITHSYSTGAVAGNSSVGGLMGSGNPNRVANSFWDTQTSGQATSDGGTGLNTAEMTDINTYMNSGWDFVGETENGTEDVWHILEGRDYPRFVWETKPSEAFIPYPHNGAVDVIQPLILSWVSGAGVLYHDVYFGEDQEVVASATMEETRGYYGQQAAEMTTYYPGVIEWGKTHYWRIDEYSTDMIISKGNVWSFTTALFIVVDDFESYNDLDPYETGSNRIFEIWIDGYEDPTNGSLVGYEIPPFVEQTIVHTGAESMSLYYDNSVGYSEATANVDNLEIDQDWTIEGIGVLALWLYGDPDNAPEPMYVALANANGLTAVVFHENPNATQVDTWTEWRIDLQAFADQGVNLTNVNTISLGLGNKNNPQAGGSGWICFDDIRLYPPSEPEPEPAPMIAGGFSKARTTPDFGGN